MLKRFRIVGLCLAAVFALSAVAASSASAYPVWQECGAGTEFTNANCTTAGGGPFGWVTLATTKASTSSGTLTLKSSIITNKCNGTDEGTIGPGSEDEISKIVATNCTCSLGGASAEPVNLPWKTKLYETNGEIRDAITGHDSTKAPGWKAKCGIFTSTCLGATSTAIKNKTDGTVDAIFDTKSANGICEGGGEGEVRGTDTIKVSGKTIRVK